MPTMSETPQYTAYEMYDISLLAKSCEHIVPNDVNFTAQEAFAFLLGANGGGKTTYVRAVGLNLELACAGCPVFARQATVYPFSRIAAHMPHDERFERTGRLDEERERVARMLDGPPDEIAFLLFNETFSGTDDVRGFALLAECAQRMVAAGHFGLYVTHFHEAESLGLPMLSAQIDPEDENRRTYRIVRKGSGASSYAADILKKYRLDRESLRERRRDCED
jgi:DNA mismatch repair ATPase MutS